jgi:hypothetical protein
MEEDNEKGKETKNKTMLSAIRIYCHRDFLVGERMAHSI